MANNKILINGIQPAVLTVQTLYSAPASGGGTRIIAFTATNTGGTIDTYDLYIVPAGGVADLTNKIISTKSVQLNDEDTPAAVHNHLIPAGGSLAISVSTISTISFRATGIEF